MNLSIRPDTLFACYELINKPTEGRSTLLDSALLSILQIQRLSAGLSMAVLDSGQGRKLIDLGCGANDEPHRVNNGAEADYSRFKIKALKTRSWQVTGVDKDHFDCPDLEHFQQVDLTTKGIGKQIADAYSQFDAAMSSSFISITDPIAIAPDLNIENTNPHRNHAFAETTEDSRTFLRRLGYRFLPFDQHYIGFLRRFCLEEVCNMLKEGGTYMIQPDYTLLVKLNGRMRPLIVDSKGITEQILGFPRQPTTEGYKAAFTQK